MNRTPVPLVHATASLLLLPPGPTPLRRSPCSSLILAALARQRRSARTPRAAWLAWFDGRPFESIRTQATLGVVFPGTTPLVYALRLG